jgi:tRNA A-37 threonylcarbamoyl transferase component Bud32
MIDKYNIEELLTLEKSNFQGEKRHDIIEENAPALNYEELIKKHVPCYTIDDYFIHVGRPKLNQGWLLHITLIPSQIEQLVPIVIPQLLSYDIPFKLIKDKHNHSRINSGSFGKYKIGKIITAYFDNESVIAPFLEKIIPLTEEFTGPTVFTDFPISNIIYTRYGSFFPCIEEDAFENRVKIFTDHVGNPMLDRYYSPPIIPIGVKNPFLQFIQNKPKEPKVYLLGNRFMPVKLLKSDAKGDVLKALYFKNGIIPKWCVIKQARKGMFPDEYGRDTRDRIFWQSSVIQTLHDTIHTPRFIDCLETQKEAYLILQYVKKGTDFSQFVYHRSKNLPWFAQPKNVKIELLDLLLQIIESIERMHAKNYIHRDITGTNFIVTRKKRIILIDLELAHSIDSLTPDPPFGIGTKGFMSPSQEQFMHRNSSCIL